MSSGCSSAHALCLVGSRQLAPRLEFPKRQVQGQLLQMDQAGGGGGLGALRVGEISGQVRPC